MDKIKLFRGDDLVINESLDMKHFTINEIVEFSEERYFGIVNLFSLRPFDLMDKLDDIGIDYESISNYDLFVFLYKSEQYIDDFKRFFGDYNFKVCEDTTTGELVILDIEKNVGIDESVYEIIREGICTIHHINPKPVYKDGNKALKRFRINKKRKERKKKENEKFESQLIDLVSSISVGTNGSITFFNVWDLPIYFAYSALIKTLKLQNYNNTMFGIYTGNISSKDVPKEQLDWTMNI